MDEDVRGYEAPVENEDILCETDATGEPVPVDDIEVPERPEEIDKEALAKRITRNALWGFERADAWMAELHARAQVLAYQRRMKAAEAAREVEAGLVSKEEFERSWRDAEDAMEHDRPRRRALMRDFVSFRRTHVRTQDGQRQPIYAAMAARYWVGSRGDSDMIAASGFLYQPVLKEDLEEVRADVQQRFRQAVSEALWKKYGLFVLPASEQLDRIEWLMIWDVDDTTVDRVRSFEQGWGVRPKGLDKPASELTGRDIMRIVAMQGHRVAPHKGTPLTPEEAEGAIEAMGHALDEDVVNEGTTLVNIDGHPARVTEETAADLIKEGFVDEWKDL